MLGRASAAWLRPASFPGATPIDDETCVPASIADCIAQAITEFNARLPPLPFTTAFRLDETGAREASSQIERAIARADSFYYGSESPFLTIMDPTGPCGAHLSEVHDFVTGFPTPTAFMEWLAETTGERGQWQAPVRQLGGAYSYEPRPMLAPGDPLFLQPGVRPFRACSWRDTIPRVDAGRDLGLSRVPGAPDLTLVQYEDDIGASCRRAREHLNTALRILRGPISVANQAILDCWFPDATADDVLQIRRALQRAYSALAHCPADYYPESDFVSGEGLGALPPQDRRDLIAAHDAGLPSATLRRTGRIALLPGWRVVPSLQATRTLHEGLHLGNFGTPEAMVDDPGELFNAYRFQGFVSQLTRLDFNRLHVASRAGVGACAR